MSLNRYSYVGDDPINAVDPDGRHIIQILDTAKIALSPIIAFGLGVTVFVGGWLACSTAIGCAVGIPTMAIGIGGGLYSSFNLAQRFWTSWDPYREVWSH